MYIAMLNQQCMFFCTILFKAIIVIPMGEGKDRPSLSPIPVTYVYLLVYVNMLTEISSQGYAQPRSFHTQYLPFHTQV